MTAVLPAALYEPNPGVEEVFASTGLTGGPWDPRLQHAGPPAALLARAIEARSAIDGGQTVRLGYDILRPVPVAPLRLEARTLRPGRRVEQLEATLSAAEDPERTPLMRVTAWRMRAEVVPLPEPAAPPPCRDPMRAARATSAGGRRRSPTTARSSGASSPGASTAPGRPRCGPGSSATWWPGSRPRRSSACW